MKTSRRCSQIYKNVDKRRFIAGIDWKKFLEFNSGKKLSMYGDSI